MPPQSDHYAILVAINRYPGIKNLYGPENDATEFQKWLLDPAYGNVAPANVRIIKSSDFAAVTDPDDANPTETQFKKVLNGWLRTKDDWKDRVGARLYLFFAGYGFTTGNLANPALFTAQAQWGDPAHIAGLQYAAKIQNAGFFDEIVFVMDCCQDVLKATQVMDPTWTPPDRQATNRVKFLQAFGAPRGQKAFETAQNTPLPRGYFSSCLLEALRDAPSDAEGYITARAVDETLATIWKDRYWEATRYNPPVHAPLNMRLYRRFSPPMVVFSATSGRRRRLPTIARASTDPLRTACFILTRTGASAKRACAPNKGCIYLRGFRLVDSGFFRTIRNAADGIRTAAT